MWGGNSDKSGDFYSFTMVADDEYESNMNVLERIDGSNNNWSSSEVVDVPTETFILIKNIP